MDLLFVCRDALASSLIGNLLLAIEAKKAGIEVGVLLTQEALAAAVGGTFGWPRELSGQELRFRMADNAASLGLATMGGRGDGRQIDARKLITQAKEAGVPLFACPIWSGLLGMKGNLPEGIKELDTGAALEMIQKAKRVVGTF
jgi:predicted peroxiredoxin